MDTLLIILGLIALAASIIGYAALWIRLNEKCSEKHQFRPLNAWSLFAATLTAIGIYVGGGIIAGGGGIPPWPWSEAFLHSQTANGLVILASGFIVAIVTLRYLISKTSLLSGLMAALLLTIAGTLFFLAILLFILMLFGVANSRKRIYILGW